MEKLAIAANCRLAWQIPADDFAADDATACYATYLASRLSLRSVFTCGSQTAARDNISEAMLAILETRPETRWDVVVRVDPRPQFFARLSEAQKLAILDETMQAMERAARAMMRIASSMKLIRETMIVKRGDDSTNWNLAAGAWNKTRDGWIGVVHALGAEAMFDECLPGKAQRLIAADVAAWHRSLGKTLDPNTQVWAELPAPWDVMLKGERCTRSMIAAACARHGMDPVKTGWIAARAEFRVASFAPTPELVHGVVVSSPQLASYLKSIGAYSGKAKTGPPIPRPALDLAINEIREHRLTQEDQQGNT